MLRSSCVEPKTQNQKKTAQTIFNINNNKKKKITEEKAAFDQVVLVVGTEMSTHTHTHTLARTHVHNTNLSNCEGWRVL